MPKEMIRMTERMAPGQPRANCGHGVYVQKVREDKFGEGAGRNVDLKEVYEGLLAVRQLR